MDKALANLNPQANPPRKGKAVHPKTERIETIISMLRGPRVLHVGCCGTRLPGSELERSRWLHSALVDVGFSVHGGDINPNSLKAMEDDGYSVEYMDAQDISAEGEKFNSIVAGELIEHLENPGLFLSGCRHRLLPGGRLVLSTPNAFSPVNFLGYAGKYLQWVNPEHTCWFDPQTISQLLERSGYRLVEIRFVDNLLADEAARLSPLAVYGKAWRLVRPLLPRRFRNDMIIHAEAIE